MIIYIGPDGRKHVDPGDLDRRQRKVLARLVRRRRRSPAAAPSQIPPAPTDGEA